MTPALLKPVARLAAMRLPRCDKLWNALEWLAMPIFVLYPQLAVLKWYRYGS